jgi:cysteinyl-tRNA synthetase
LSLYLYNTLTRRKEEFVPLFDRKVRMYVCGPTVYDHAHIGNARPIIVFDVLFRLLRHIYGADRVVYARNITDIDDKINARAREEGVPISQITSRTTAQFHQDVAALGALKPTVEPRATDHIAQMIDMIETLIEKGCAYAADGHVLFHVPSMESYGQLARRSMDEMVAGARVDVAPYKKDPMDFVLWKPSDKSLPGWDSPWGRGRPGWHIECSAMARRHLGETFDIHGGGIDLVFPHHENEIAQSCCAHGTKVMANYWLHNGHLQVEGEKMSKSLGNFLTISDLLKEYPGEALRLNMLSTHYRQPFNWTAAGVKNAFATLDTWYKLTADVHEPSDAFISSTILEALEDDLNTPRAITEMHNLRQRAASGDFEARHMLKASARLMGLLTRDTEDWLAWRPAALKIDAAEIEALIVARAAARAAKDFAEADRLREEIEAKGVRISDGPEGTSWEVAR